MKKQRYALVVLLALAVASGLTSLRCYRETAGLVEADMSQALQTALAEQTGDAISPDTIRTFNRHLKMERLRGKALLAVDTGERHFRAYAQCSRATILGLSDQRPALALWTLTLLWGVFVALRRRPVAVPAVQGVAYGGLTLAEADGRFFAADGQPVRLTPMQRQLMEMFFRSPSHALTKTEICDALWPKKTDASETLYTLMRRLRPIVERHSSLRIETDRGRAYELKVRQM